MIMTLKIILIAVATCLYFPTGEALQCYQCSTTLGLPGSKVDEGCSPGKPMDSSYLKDCASNQTYCGRHYVLMTLTTSSDILNVKIYTLKCASVKNVGCDKDVYNQTVSQDSNGCHISCQTDGCNGFQSITNFTTSATEYRSTAAGKMPTPASPIATSARNTDPAVEQTSSPKMTTKSVVVTTDSYNVIDTTSHGSSVLQQRFSLYAAICCIILSLIFV